MKFIIIITIINIFYFFIHLMGPEKFYHLKVSWDENEVWIACRG